MPKATEAPKKIHLSSEDVEALKARVEADQMTDRDRKLILNLIVFNIWVQERLSRAKLSLQRLKNVFGIVTEKKTVKKKKRW